MDGEATTISPDAPPPRFGASRAWDGVLLVILGWHFWLCLGLFEGDKPGEILLNDEPLLAGRHALHFYQGYLGAQALIHRGQTLVYDPVFYAGYLKTPWYDAGSKPAELFLVLARGQLLPAAYKMGVLCTWFFLPLAVALAARLAGLGPCTGCLAAGLTLAIAWSQFGRERLWAGDVDLLMGGGLAALTLALAINYHQRPHPVSCAFLCLVAWLLCWIQPLIFLAVLPSLAIAYFGAGSGHRLAWHLGWVAVIVGAAWGNWFWLHDALRFWWVRTEAASLPFAAQTSLGHLILQSPVLKDELHRGFALSLLVGGVLGVGGMMHGQRGVAARTLGTALVTYLAIGLFGPVWAPTAHVDPGRAFFVSLLLATIPAAEAVTLGIGWVCLATGSWLRGAATAVIVLFVAGAGLNGPLRSLAKVVLQRQTLPVGLSEELRTTVEDVRRLTTREARILWEEDSESQVFGPLLPWFTERYFMSGMGACGKIEHAVCGLAEGKLEGQPLADWSDRDLAEYCRRYNVGWIACRSESARQRLARWSLAAPVAQWPRGTLFEVRQAASYVLVGQARVERCDHELMTLIDVVPYQGHVVLSFHHHAGIRSSLDRVTIEKEPQLHDPIPLLRLKVPQSISRLTLYWSD